MPSSVLFLCVRFQSAVSYLYQLVQRNLPEGFPVAFRTCPAAPEGLLFLYAEIPAGNTQHGGPHRYQPAQSEQGAYSKGFRVASKANAASVPSSLGVILCTADFQTSQFISISIRANTIKTGKGWYAGTFLSMLPEVLPDSHFRTERHRLDTFNVVQSGYILPWLHSVKDDRKKNKERSDKNMEIMLFPSISPGHTLCRRGSRRPLFSIAGGGLRIFLRCWQRHQPRWLFPPSFLL